jgi:serine/threonine protein kinase
MPYLSHLIELKIPVPRARPYFRALASAVAYLHERGITHNDIKPANIVMNYSDVPVLVDFGFAKKHELGTAHRFLSTVRMGTPEVSTRLGERR